MGIVVVGCKIPQGFYMELIQEGPTKFKPAPRGKRVLIKGSNTIKNALIVNPAVVSYATTLVDEEFAREWFKRNENADMVLNKLVFMEEHPADAKAAIRENAKNPTGLEPIDPSKKVRVKNDSGQEIEISADEDHLALMKRQAVESNAAAA